ncbi:hypothetical protein BZK31_17875 [Pseudomonas floridensis]|uniref:Uncharacterized protein n=1 Tax=Pseudomonas floridensis TaxID=1958950 RepID=A0A1X0N304_9PSED|nr:MULTISPECIES: hypothetical protein [Pseudomonas]AZG86601.1 hypothetical protein N032_13625 [Pseudomonas syringae pv. pisi str. PP1]ORC57894.1 hypothetical protein BZK31_17875 [Pseudomonas floridensis]RMM24076.1 hypothetical protein ALQ81_03232 [Pseudomonas syringae pv. pisi]UZS65035.1 hypothetical protein OQB64_13165 [Pseudomonas syringae]
MSYLRRMFNRAVAIPSTNQALVSVVACPVLYAVACSHTPQISEYLSGLGVHVSTMQLFVAGSTAYCAMLGYHRMFNNSVRYTPDIERHRQLATACQAMVVVGMIETAGYKAMAHERDGIKDRLGFLVDADNFYRKLNRLVDLMRVGLRYLRQLSR